MEKRKIGKLQLTRETLKNLTNEQMDKVAGGRTEYCTTDTSIGYSVCWKCQPSGVCETYDAGCDTMTCYKETDTCTFGDPTLNC